MTCSPRTSVSCHALLDSSSIKWRERRKDHASVFRIRLTDPGAATAWCRWPSVANSPRCGRRAGRPSRQPGARRIRSSRRQGERLPGTRLREPFVIGLGHAYLRAGTRRRCRLPSRAWPAEKHVGRPYPHALCRLHPWPSVAADPPRTHRLPVPARPARGSCADRPAQSRSSNVQHFGPPPALRSSDMSTRCGW